MKTKLVSPSGFFPGEEGATRGEDSKSILRQKEKKEEKKKEK